MGLDNGGNGSVTCVLTVNKRDRTRLKRRLKRLGITHEQVRIAAGVHRTTVVNTLAGRMKSRNVVATAERLIVEALTHG